MKFEIFEEIFDKSVRKMPWVHIHLKSIQNTLQENKILHWLSFKWIQNNTRIYSIDSVLNHNKAFKLKIFYCLRESKIEEKVKL